MVMPAQHSCPLVHYWAGKHPGKIGWLVSPPISKTRLREWMPFALDNGAFPAWVKQQEWNEGAWLQMLQHVRMTGMQPLWVLVPDVVANKIETIRRWNRYAPEIQKHYGWKLAFAAQDGMRAEDVPVDAEVVFVGGSDAWKWGTVAYWAEQFPRVHVGRVNELDKLEYCDRLGVESVDGTGWFRGTDEGRQARALRFWMENGTREKEPELELV